MLLDSPASPIFLRWAGGKRWALPYLHQIVGRRKFNCYVEPFLGGGSLFLEFGYQAAKRYSISDIDESIVNTFQMVKKQSDNIVLKLERWSPTKAQYYALRDGENLDRSPEENAARFIFLNRLAWNGLYRVNTKGKFNVPFSPKQVPPDLGDRIQVASQRLTAIPGKVVARDYKVALQDAGSGDLVLLDPPYVDKVLGTTPHRYYAKNQFQWEDQTQMVNLAAEAVQRGAFVVVMQGRGAAESAFAGAPFTKLSVFRKQIIAASSGSRRATKETLLLSRNLEYYG